MVDALASEYGWTHQYIFESLTRSQIELYLHAIGERYKRQSDSFDKHKTSTSADDDDLSIDDIIKKKRFTELNDMYTVLNRGGNGHS